MEDGKSILDITIVQSEPEFAQVALENFLTTCQCACKESGSFKVALSGGHTPEGFFRLLSKSSEAKALPWNHVHIFWVDERCTDPDSDESNYHLAKCTFLNTVSIPPENIHRIAAETSDLAVAVAEYEQSLCSVFNIEHGQMPEFDLILLGMGTDGHIGSLFPDSFAHFDTNEIVSPVYVMTAKLNRITLTHPVISAARKIILLISGIEKAKIVKNIFTEEPDEVKYPVHSLWPILHKVSWIIDKDAASEYISLSAVNGG